MDHNDIGNPYGLEELFFAARNNRNIHNETKLSSTNVSIFNRVGKQASELFEENEFKGNLNVAGTITCANITATKTSFPVSNVEISSATPVATTASETAHLSLFESQTGNLSSFTAPNLSFNALTGVMKVPKLSLQDDDGNTWNLNLKPQYDTSTDPKTVIGLNVEWEIISVGSSVQMGSSTTFT